MDAAGFSRSGVPGEYSPNIAYTHLTTDVSSTTSFVQILSLPITVTGTGEVWSLLFSASGDQLVTGGTSYFRILVDGAVYNGTASTSYVGGATWSQQRVFTVSGLTPGLHTITVEWKNPGANGSRILASTSPNIAHAQLIAYPRVPVSGREMDGFTQLGWQTIYTENLVSAELSATKTSTATTQTDALFTGVQYTSRYPQSSLLIRFSACGVSLDGASVLNSTFRVYVDGAAVCGTGCSDASAGGNANAMCVVVVPVQAGVHNVDVKWAGGGGSGTSIDPSSTGCHAALSIEEVFCGDLNTISDMETVPALGYASRNLPRVSYTSLKSDFTNGSTDIPLLQTLFYATGEQGALLIEATGSLTANTQFPIFRIVVDGVQVYGCESTEPSGGTNCLAIAAAVNVPQGNHLIQLFFNGVMTFEPASHPEYSHANMVVREVARLQ